jgi:hypothetical protein
MSLCKAEEMQKSNAGPEKKDLPRFQIDERGDRQDDDLVKKTIDRLLLHKPVSQGAGTEPVTCMQQMRQPLMSAGGVPFELLPGTVLLSARDSR